MASQPPGFQIVSVLDGSCGTVGGVRCWPEDYEFHGALEEKPIFADTTSNCGYEWDLVTANVTEQEDPLSGVKLHVKWAVIDLSFWCKSHERIRSTEQPASYWSNYLHKHVTALNVDRWHVQQPSLRYGSITSLAFCVLFGLVFP